uniref:Uncharacterized protein n=1 Tax=Chorda asiatica TaxID=1281577 RepID=A0A8F0FCF8_9PHAE|nr:hypothetical protein [Chorda asiatica]
MENPRRYSDNDLILLYESSPLFKKYCLFDFWSEHFYEYETIKYCETYFYKYLYAFCQSYLSQHCSLFFLSTLHRNYYFVKFHRSGFIKYMDYNFLLLFYENRFLGLLESSNKIEIFVDEYFQKCIKKIFEADLMACLIKSVSLNSPKCLRRHLDNRFKFLYKQIFNSQGHDNFLFNRLLKENYVLNRRLEDKKECVARSESKDLVKNFYYIFRLSFYSSISFSEIFLNSYCGNKDKVYSSIEAYVYFFDIDYLKVTNIFLETTENGWGSFYKGGKNSGSDEICRPFLSYLNDSFILFNYFGVITNRITLSLSSLQKYIDKCFCVFVRPPYKYVGTNLLTGYKHFKPHLKSDVQALVESVEGQEDFDSQSKTTSIPFSIVKVFEKKRDIVQLKASFKSVTKLKLSIDKLFSNHSDKKKVFSVESRRSRLLDLPKKDISPLKNLIKDFDRFPKGFIINDVMEIDSYLDDTFEKTCGIVPLDPQERFQVFCPVLQTIYNNSIKIFIGLFLTSNLSFFDSLAGIIRSSAVSSTNLVETVHIYAVNKIFEYWPRLSVNGRPFMRCTLIGTSFDWGIYQSKCFIWGRHTFPNFTFCFVVPPFSYIYLNNYGMPLFIWENFYVTFLRGSWGVYDSGFKSSCEYLNVKSMEKSLDQVSQKYNKNFAKIPKQDLTRNIDVDGIEKNKNLIWDYEISLSGSSRGDPDDPLLEYFVDHFLSK